jgi:hypothetical protein
LGKRSRKARQQPRPRPAAYAKAEAKNQAVRETLVPLEEGERPTAVTVSAGVALVLAVTEIPLYFAFDGDKRPSVAGAVFFLGLMLFMAWGLWRAKYWAVLGFQALLAIAILIFAGVLLIASNVLAAVVCVVTIALAGTLFWYMVKAMARIQMPERR